MKKISLLAFIFLTTFTGAHSQGFFNALKKEIQKEEQEKQALNNSSAQANGSMQKWVKVTFGNEMPSDALVGGKDGDGADLIVAHANYLGNWHPGKTRKSWNNAHIEYGGKEFAVDNFEVLIGNDGFSWSGVSGGNMPANAVSGGQESQHTLFICRCEYQGTTQLGKTWQGNTACNIGYGGNGVNVPTYEVLVQAGGVNVSSSPTVTQPGPSAAVPVAAVAVSSNSNLKAYGNYDFIPGETILFEDNFQGEQDGEFPSKWDLEKGQAVLNKVNGELAFFITEGNYAYVTPLVKNKSYLTDPFTIEVDYYVQADHRNGVGIFLECADNSQKSLWFNEAGEVSSSGFTRDFSSPFPDTNAKLFGQWHHAAFIFKNGQIKTYLDQYRVTIMPNTGISPVSIKVGGIGSMDNPMIFKNLKIASGGSMNMIGRKFTDAKIVTHGIKFDVGKATLRPESMGTLNMVKQVMIDNPELKFEVDGHTDNDGDAASNLKLSQDRADAVRLSLIDLGIDGSRLTTKGFGLTKPISDNNSSEGKANNRRVEFVRL